jgi:hypothetical protein
MANSTSHFGLPYPVYDACYSLAMVFLDADGDPTDQVTPDTEISKDMAGFADCTNEVAADTVGFGYLTLTSTEMSCSVAEIASKCTSGPKTTPVILYPRKLPILTSGTAQAGAAGTITLASGASALDDCYNGCIVKTTGGTGGAAGARQARVVMDYNGTTKVATIGPNNWETNPANDTTYEVYLTELRPNPSIDDAVKAKTDNLPASPAAVGSAMTLSDAAITSAKFASGAITAEAVATDAIGAAELAADAVTEIQSGLATAAALATVDGIVDTIAIDVAGLDGAAMRGTDSAATATNLAAAKTVIDTIAVDVAGLDGAAMRGTDNAATASALATHDGKLDTVDTVVDGIAAKTVNLPASPAAVGSAMTLANDALSAAALKTDAVTEIQNGLATATDLATVDTVADGIKTVTDHLGTALELDGAVYRLTSNALEQAPSGGASVGEIADGVWDEAIGGHVIPGSTAALLQSAGGAANPLDSPLADHDVEDTFGNVLNDVFEEIAGTYRFTNTALAMAPTGSGRVTLSASSREVQLTASGEVINGDGSIEVRRQTDNSIVYTWTGQTIEGATIWFTVREALDEAGNATDSDAVFQVVADLTTPGSGVFTVTFGKTQLDECEVGKRYWYGIRARLSGGTIVDLMTGRFSVLGTTTTRTT